MAAPGSPANDLAAISTSPTSPASGTVSRTKSSPGCAATRRCGGNRFPKAARKPGRGVLGAVEHADVQAANRDTELFGALDGPSLADNPEMRGQMLVTMDGRQHLRQRRLISAGFTPRMVGRLETPGATLGDRDRRERARARDLRLRPGRRLPVPCT